MARYILLAGVLMLAPALFLQGQGQGKGKGKGKAAEAPTPSVPHDPHDLNGVWRRSGGVLTMSNETPPMTAWAKAKFDAAKPVYGPRAVPGGLGNDSAFISFTSTRGRASTGPEVSAITRCRAASELLARHKTRGDCRTSMLK